MAQALKDRLNQIIPKLEDRAFLANEGIGNEIGFYIFDYPPEDELAVRDAVSDRASVYDEGVSMAS